MQHLLLFINWNPDPNFLTVGNFSIKWYGVLWGLSLFSVFFSERYVFRKLKKDEEKVTLAIQYVFIGGLIGARLAHILFYNLDYYSAHPSEVIAVWKGGLASHGGLVGGITGLYLFCKRNTEFKTFWLLDFGAIGVPFLASLIRLGNLMNSELCGIPTNLPWGFVFQQVDNIPRHPVVLYESITYFFLQLFMFYLFNKYKESKPGIYIASLLLILFSTRFFLEFLKVPEGDLLFGFISKTQALNLPFIITGAILYWLSFTKKLSYSTSKTSR